MASAFLGLGHHLPPWQDRFGVRRPILSEPGGPSMLAAPAARAALAKAGIAESETEFVVFATMTPDVTFPGAGCFLQREMEFGTIGALDVRGQCAGFLYGLAIANDFLECGVYRRILLVGAEVISSALDETSRGESVARRFGDGAGAVVLGPSEGDAGVRAVVLHNDGARHEAFWCEYPASRQHPTRFTHEDFLAGKHFPVIDESALRAAGEQQLPAGIREVLDRAHCSVGDIDHFFVSHAVPEVARAAAAELGIDQARVTVPSEEYGHLVAAALPVALSVALEAGVVQPGATVCLAAAGAGLASGAAVVVL